MGPKELQELGLAIDSAAICPGARFEVLVKHICAVRCQYLTNIPYLRQRRK